MLNNHCCVLVVSPVPLQRSCHWCNRPLLLSSCTFPEDERSATACASMIDTLKDKAKLLEEWRGFLKAMHGSTHDTPSSAGVGLTKLKDGVVTSDTCGAARLTSDLLVEAIEEKIKEMCEIEGVDCEQSVVRIDCHHHLRNVWIGALNKCLSKCLNNILQLDLSAIDFCHRVSTMFDAVLRSVDKEFSLRANCPKGRGDFFKLRMEIHHPGALLLPVERSGGSRQDLAVEGAATVCWSQR